MKTLKDMTNLDGKKVLVRVDFNVPMKNGRVTDDTRIRAALPTVRYLLEKGCPVILLSHLGNPKGQVVPELSLEPVARRLEEIFQEEGLELELEVRTDIKRVGKKFVFNSPDPAKVKLPKVCLLENVRFWPEEEANDGEFARCLSGLGEVFVQEAFACCHRSHASIVGPPRYLPSCAGFLVQKEAAFLAMLLDTAERPFVAIIGGNKIESKGSTISRISEIADLVIVSSPIEKEIREQGIALKFPERIVGPLDESEKDISPETLDYFKQKIALAKTVFWSGPMGVFEEERYARGTMEIAKAVTEVPCSVVGGGHTGNAVRKAGVADKITFISTGGGATLKFLEKGTLPGISALEQKNKEAV